MTFRPKIWTGLGLGVAMAGLAACGGESGEAGEGEHGAATEQHASSPGEAGEQGEGELGAHGGETGEAGEDGEGGESGEGGEAGEAGAAETMSLPKRLAFMSGHVEAGLALYRAGEPDMAAKHLLHPVSETHADERAGLDALGFNGALFETVSAALDAGQTAVEIEPQLKAAEENLALVAEQAGGDTVEILDFLIAVTVEEYTAGVPADTVEIAGEYQDAYGFAVVARQRAESLDGEDGARVRAEIDNLIALWPENGPVPPEAPTPASAIAAQASSVTLELSAFR